MIFLFNFSFSIGSLNNPIQIDDQGNRKLSCQLDLRAFQPKEINVVLDSKNRCINIDASHDISVDGKNCVKRNYSRKLKIPDSVGCDLSKIDINSNLTNDGILVVEAPLPRLSMEEARNFNKGIMGYPANTCKLTTKVI